MSVELMSNSKYKSALFIALLSLALASCGGNKTGNNGTTSNGGSDTGVADTGGDQDSGCVESNGGVEICDGKDNDCDGEIDEDAEDAETYYTDNDGDDFGDDETAQTACEQPSGTVTQGGDCDDTNPASIRMPTKSATT